MVQWQLLFDVCLIIEGGLDLWSINFIGQFFPLKFLTTSLLFMLRKQKNDFDSL